MKLNQLSKEDKEELRRYRKHRNLAGHIYDQLRGDIVLAMQTREQYMRESVLALESNYQRNMERKEDAS